MNRNFSVFTTVQTSVIYVNNGMNYSSYFECGSCGFGFATNNEADMKLHQDEWHKQCPELAIFEWAYRDQMLYQKGKVISKNAVTVEVILERGGDKGYPINRGFDSEIVKHGYTLDTMCITADKYYFTFCKISHICNKGLHYIPAHSKEIENVYKE